MKRGSKEHGQIMILLALAIIVLLGFTALAVDMGMAYADRRQAQNAADAAALAGAQNTGSWIKGNNGSCNGFGAAQKSAAQTAAAAAASKFYPSVTPTVDVSDCQNGQVGVTVSLSHTVHGAVFQRDTTNAVQAAAGVKTGGIADGFGLVSLGGSCENDGILLNGNVDVLVTNGGIFSNSCIDKTGHGSGSIKVRPPARGILFFDRWLRSPEVADPRGQKADYQITAPSFGDELSKRCSEIPSRGSHSGSGTLNYGLYDSISMQNKGSLTLNPGLYCVNGSFSVKGTVVGHGVTLYLKTSGITLKGGDSLELSAPTDETNYGIPGLVVYFDEGNSSSLDLGGNPDFLLTGTVLVPNGTIELSGNSSVSAPIRGQAIGKRVHLNGTDPLTINYDPSVSYKGAATLDLLR